MRKILVILLSICLFTTVLSACDLDSDESKTSKYYKDEFGNNVIERVNDRTVMVHDLPRSIPYNGNEISLMDVSFYENCPNFSHSLYIVITIDVSTLSEEEIHWLRKSDLSVNAYITNEANNYDFSSAVSLGNVFFTDTKQLIFVKTSSFSKENRHSFKSSDISTVIAVTQEETYEYKNSKGEISNLNKTETIHYTTTTGSQIPDAESIEKPLYDYVAKWLYDNADSYAVK